MSTNDEREHFKLTNNNKEQHKHGDLLTKDLEDGTSLLSQQQRKNEELIVKICANPNCQSEQSGKWFTSKTEEILGRTVCKRCYHKEIVDSQDKVCSSCGTDKTSGCWYKSKRECASDKDLCQRCYKKESRVMTDKTCLGCRTTRSSQWTRSKLVPGADLCTQCYRKETKIREGKIDVTELKRKIGMKDAPKDDLERSATPGNLSGASPGVGNQGAASAQTQKVKKKSYYQKKRPVIIIPDLTPEEAEKILQAAVVPKTEKELEEEKKTKGQNTKCCDCGMDELDNRWKDSVVHLNGKLCDICYFKELLFRGGMPLKV